MTRYHCGAWIPLPFWEITKYCPYQKTVIVPNSFTQIFCFATSAAFLVPLASCKTLTTDCHLGLIRMLHFIRNKIYCIPQLTLTKLFQLVKICAFVKFLFVVRDQGTVPPGTNKYGLYGSVVITYSQ